MEGVIEVDDLLEVCFDKTPRHATQRTQNDRQGHTNDNEIDVHDTVVDEDRGVSENRLRPFICLHRSLYSLFVNRTHTDTHTHQRLSRGGRSGGPGDKLEKYFIVFKDL